MCRIWGGGHVSLCRVFSFGYVAFHKGLGSICSTGNKQPWTQKTRTREMALVRAWLHESQNPWKGGKGEPTPQSDFHIKIITIAKILDIRKNKYLYRHVGVCLGVLKLRVILRIQAEFQATLRYILKLCLKKIKHTGYVTGEMALVGLVDCLFHSIHMVVHKHSYLQFQGSNTWPWGV